MEAEERNGDGVQDVLSDVSALEERLTGKGGDGLEDEVEAAFPRVHIEEDPFTRRDMPPPVQWSVVWSDLMMTMFIFFLVMYVYKDANKIFLGNEGLGSDYGKIADTMDPFSGGGPLGEGEGLEKSMVKIYDFSKQILEKENLQSFASVSIISDDAVRIRLSSDLLFDSGQVELSPVARSSLLVIANILRRTPYVINIVGHTDDVPVRSPLYANNWELSVMRASAVARFLVEDMRLPPERLYISGHASYMPIRPNDTPRNRAANRRVEIVITKKMPFTSREVSVQ